MSEEPKFANVTTKAAVATFRASEPIFEGVVREVRGLSKKKPEATMSASKVKIVNRVLEDLLTILKDEPSGKYLELLSDATLPQMSDAVLTMVQFETALKAFKNRYHQYIKSVNASYWITTELIEDWKARDKANEEKEEGDDDDSGDEDDDDSDEDDDE